MNRGLTANSMPIYVGMLLVTLGMASLAIGARNIPIQMVVDALVNAQSDNLMHAIVGERVPRTVFSLIAGAALGVSGALMQAVTRNPLADPSILGVNTGASLFVVIGLTFFKLTMPLTYIVWALMGAGITAVLVYALGSIGYGGATPIKLALAGAATSAALASAISALVLPRTDVMNAYRFWQIGTVSGATWEGIFWSLPFVGAAFLLTWFLLPSLDAMALGDETAISLGVNTGRIRGLSALAAIVLCGVVTALAGPIGFVGLMVPHLVRLIVGIRLQNLVPYSAAVGAGLLTLADVMGRWLGRPGELEVGIVTAFMGAPLLIGIVRRTRIKL